MSRSILDASIMLVGWATALVAFLNYRRDKRASEAKTQGDLAEVGRNLVATMGDVLDRVKEEASEEVATLKAKVELLEGNLARQQKIYLDKITEHSGEIAKKDALIEQLQQQVAELLRRVDDLERHEKPQVTVTRHDAPRPTVTVTT